MKQTVSKPFQTKTMVSTKAVKQSNPLRCKEKQRLNDNAVRSKVFKKSRSGGAISTQKTIKRERC